MNDIVRESDISRASMYRILKKRYICPGGAGEGAICAPSLKSTLKDKSVSTILTPIAAFYVCNGRNDRSGDKNKSFNV